MRPAYGAKENEICHHPTTIVVDIANVMGSRPDGWWRDRPAAAVRLHTELTALAASGRPVLPDDTEPEAFVMVLEGAARPAAARIDAAGAARIDAGAARIDAGAARIDAAPGAGVRVVQADGSGDDAIVALVRDLPGRRVVVTADRELRRRCEAAGAEVLGPGWLIRLFRERPGER
jgi:8-oxo-dGTP diphosphatase